MSRNSNKKHKSPAKKRISAKRGKKAMKLKNFALHGKQLLGMSMGMILSKRDKLLKS